MKKTRAAVAYASNSGNTMQAAEAIADELRAAGLEADVRDVAGSTPQDLDGYDLWVLGSCTWLRQKESGPAQGELPGQMHRFVRELVSRKAPGQSFAIFAFGRREYTKFCAAADHLEEAVSAAGGYLAAETLRIDGFFEPNERTVREWGRSLAGLTAARAPS